MHFRRVSLLILGFVLAVSGISAHAAQARSVQAFSTSWQSLVDDFLRRMHNGYGGDPLAYPESTADKPMAGAQLVYDDMGGDDSLLNLTSDDADVQSKELADLFVALGGDMEKETWTNTDRERSELLVDYYIAQGGAFPLY
jgi:hypothetical protein